MKTISTIGRDWLKVKLFTPEFNLTTHDSYVTILVEVFMNHILAESTYFTNHIEQGEHSIMVLKLSNKYQIIWHVIILEIFLSMIISFVNIFYQVENSKLKG